MSQTVSPYFVPADAPLVANTRSPSQPRTTPDREAFQPVVQEALLLYPKKTVSFSPVRTSWSSPVVTNHTMTTTRAAATKAATTITTTTTSSSSSKLAMTAKPFLSHSSPGRGQTPKQRQAPQQCHRSSPTLFSPVTKDALAAQDHFTPPSHTAYAAAKGFVGLLDKTKDVPSLLDDSDSLSSSKATSVLWETASIPPEKDNVLEQHYQHHSSYGNNKSSSSSSSHNSGHYKDPVHSPSNHNRPRHERETDNDSDVFDGLSAKESDVFDNLSNVDGWSGVGSGSGRNQSNLMSPRKSALRKPFTPVPERIAEEEGLNPEDDEDANASHLGDFKLVMLKGGLAAIQTNETGFSNRQTASDFDDNLTSSEVDQYGFCKTPAFHEMLKAGTARDNSLKGIHGNIGTKQSRPTGPTSRDYGTLGAAPRTATMDEDWNHYHHSNDRVNQSHKSFVVDGTPSETGSSLFTDPYDAEGRLSIDGDLSEYYIPRSDMKKVLKAYRVLADIVRADVSLAEFEREEDEHKAFALFEMRSRIMEKDIERGLERRGGTVVVDDIVTTPYHRASHRVRDAVIVSKAWRDGASPMDVVHTARLTRRDLVHYIKRPYRPSPRANQQQQDHPLPRFTWEQVTWLDDTDFMLYRCPSLGPRHMRGSEMFTIGDCQSILLKLTNDRCNVS